MPDYTEFGSRYTVCECCDWTSTEHTYDIADNGARNIAVDMALKEWQEHFDDAHRSK